MANALVVTGSALGKCQFVVDSDKHSLTRLLYINYIGFLIFIYLLLAMLGLPWCMWARFSCGDWRLLSGCAEQASHCGGFSVAMCGLSHSEARRILLDQAPNPTCVPTTGPSGKSSFVVKNASKNRYLSFRGEKNTDTKW